MSKEVILTGIRANNDLHIGNYFGALLPMVDMAKTRSDEYEINLFVPDLHSFTTPIDHSKLQEQILHNLKLFVAAGLPLDNPNIHIYRQSYIPAHSEMTWILDCFTGFGEMRRMTQFKDKIGAVDVGKSLTDLAKNDETLQKYLSLVEKNRGSELEEIYARFTYDYAVLATSIAMGDRVSVGLFNYPVLMAADILLYGAKYVPVGDDQSQHLEFTRDIATRMNNQFGERFVVPEPVKKQHAFFGKDQGLRIKDLADPTRKMSKSTDSDKGVIFLGDNPEEAAKKVMSAATDSESSVGTPDMKDRPGVANLLQILDLLNPDHPDASGMGYKGFKELVAGNVRDFLADFQAKLAAVDEQKILEKLESDEKNMSNIANVTLLKVQKAVGLRPKD